MIREINESDINFLDSSIHMGFIDAWNKEMLLSSFLAKNINGYIFYENEKSLGFITFSCALDSADIESLFTLPDERNKGIAKELLTVAINYIYNQGIKRIFIEVKESNLVAKNLYLKFGFKEISIRKKYYKDGKSAIVMLKEIEL